MLSETRHNLDNLPGPLVDLDLTPSGNWIGVTELGDSQLLLFHEQSIPLSEEFRFPKVRAIDDHTAVIVNSRTRTEHNGQIISASGATTTFYAGDAIQDVLASDKFIVITYFDESALTSRGIEGNGVAVFDIGGHFLFGYRDLFGDEAVDIADCYAACWAADSRMLFFPYADFPVVSFDLKEKTQMIWGTPDSVVGCGAISARDDSVFFHGSYRNKHTIFEWKLGNETAQEMGTYPGQLRGLTQGKFLAVQRSGYVIVSPTPPGREDFALLHN